LSVRFVFLIFLLFSVCALQTTSTASAPTDQNGATHPEMLVSTQWLSEHLSDPKVVVLQVGHERSRFDQRHIPGARFLSDAEFTTGHTGVMIELPSVDKLKQLFESVGISDDSRVVIYTSDWYPIAARAFFTLDYLGHTNTALLDGSIEQWLAENRPVTNDAAQVAAGKITPHANESVRALLADAKSATQQNSSTILVDSRPQKRYASGHLAGADLVFWEETVQNPEKPVFRTPDQLRTLLQSRGVVPGHKLITYCEIGYQASHMYFVAKYLGYDAQMYDGSYYEWSEVEHLPVVKGRSPR
jgi:thiosulfate/3-mercaptopyruvate sulfurtransferase